MHVKGNRVGRHAVSVPQVLFTVAAVVVGRLANDGRHITLEEGRRLSGGHSIGSINCGIISHVRPPAHKQDPTRLGF